MLQIRKTRLAAQRNQFSGQFIDDRFELLWIKNARGFGEAAGRKAFDAQHIGHVIQSQGPLELADGVEQGIEEVEEDDGTIVVHEKLAVAGSVAFATNLM